MAISSQQLVANPRRHCGLIRVAADDRLQLVVGEIGTVGLPLGIKVHGVGPRTRIPPTPLVLLDSFSISSKHSSLRDFQIGKRSSFIPNNSASHMAPNR